VVNGHDRAENIKPNAPKPFSISIMEDDKAVRDALHDLLESAGLMVKAFGSAEEFVGSSLLGNSCCLIVDVRLPRMSGLELQSHLFAQGNSIPMILITGHGDEDVREHALRNGALGFFYKPLNIATLSDLVHSTVGSRRRRRLTLERSV
jgi:FixJ family two-component response regulator